MFRPRIIHAGPAACLRYRGTSLVRRAALALLALLALLVIAPAAKGQTIGEHMTAEVHQGIVDQTTMREGWLPGRIVFSWNNLSYTALMHMNAETYNRHARENAGRGAPDAAQFDQAINELARAGREEVAPLALELKRTGPDQSPEELAAFALAFVQALPYSLDAMTTLNIDTWRAPLQTLIDVNIDCEDSSILFISLLSALGIDSAAIIVPGHMLAAVHGGFQGKGVPGHEGYHYAETTGNSWRIGTLPPAIDDTEILFFHIPASSDGKTFPVKTIKNRGRQKEQRKAEPTVRHQVGEKGMENFLLFLVLVAVLCFGLWFAWDIGLFGKKSMGYGSGNDIDRHDDWN